MKTSAKEFCDAIATSIARYGKSDGVLRRDEIGKGCDCNTCRGNPHLRHVWNVPSHEFLHSKQQKECDCFSTIVNYCVVWTIAAENNYCSETPCGIHPFSEHPLRERFAAGPRSKWRNRWCLLFQESPRQTKPKKGPKRKVHMNVAHF